MAGPLIIPSDRLSSEALEGLVEEFVSREGTDYGETIHTLEEKCAHVFSEIEKGEVVIVYEPEGQSCDLRLRRDLPE